MNLIILILGLLSAFGPLSIDMYLPALPNIAKAMGADLASVQLSLASYFVGIASGQIFYGPITDKYGRKKPLYFGLIVYGIASVFCATTSSVDGLIAFRFLQALGACAGMVISRAVVRDLYQSHEAAKVYSLLMLIMGIAPILAPVAGGMLMTQFGWRSIFWFLSVVSVLTFLAVLFFLKETAVPHPDHKLSNALKNYREVLKDRLFLGYSFSMSFVYAGLFAYITGSSFVFIEYFHLTPSEYSMLFGVNAFGLIAFSQVNARLLRRFSPEELIRKALPITLVSAFFLMVSAVSGARLFYLCLPLFFFILSLGMIAPNAAASALANQKKSSGSASAMMGTIQFTVSALTSTLVSRLHNGTPAPMASVIFGCACVAVVLYLVLVHRKRKPVHS